MRAKHLKHRFLRQVVKLCLIMLTFITFSVVALAWHSGEQLSPATVGSLAGAWCGELLMSLLKRNNENKQSSEGESI